MASGLDDDGDCGFVSMVWSLVAGFSEIDLRRCWGKMRRRRRRRREGREKKGFFESAPRPRLSCPPTYCQNSQLQLQFYTLQYRRPRLLYARGWSGAWCGGGGGGGGGAGRGGGAHSIMSCRDPRMFDVDSILFSFFSSLQICLSSCNIERDIQRSSSIIFTRASIVLHAPPPSLRYQVFSVDPYRTIPTSTSTPDRISPEHFFWLVRPGMPGVRGEFSITVREAY